MKNLLHKMSRGTMNGKWNRKNLIYSSFIVGRVHKISVFLVLRRNNKAKFLINPLSFTLGSFCGWKSAPLHAWQSHELTERLYREKKPRCVSHAERARQRDVNTKEDLIFTPLDSDTHRQSFFLVFSPCSINGSLK